VRQVFFDSSTLWEREKDGETNGKIETQNTIICGQKGESERGTSQPLPTIILVFKEGRGDHALIKESLLFKRKGGEPKPAEAFYLSYTPPEKRKERKGGGGGGAEHGRRYRRQLRFEYNEIRKGERKSLGTSSFQLMYLGLDALATAEKNRRGKKKCPPPV